MASITWANATDLVPGMPTTAASAQTAILAHVNTVLAVDEFGGEDGEALYLARCYLAAHFAIAGGRASAGAAGPVASESGGGLSRTYAGVSTVIDRAMLATTAPGQAYLTIVRMSPARAVVVL